MLDQVVPDFQDERFTRGGRVIREHGDAHASFEVHRDQHIADHEVPKHQIRAADAIARVPTEGVLHDVSALSQTDAIPIFAHPGPEVSVGTAIRLDRKSVV